MNPDLLDAFKLELNSFFGFKDRKASSFTFYIDDNIQRLDYEYEIPNEEIGKVTLIQSKKPLAKETHRFTSMYNSVRQNNIHTTDIKVYNDNTAKTLIIERLLPDPQPERNSHHNTTDNDLAYAIKIMRSIKTRFEDE